MAKRQMIIEISEQDYEKLQRDSYHSFDKYMAYIAMKDGKLLPKGHGRLIDADALYDSAPLCHTEEDGTACVEWREIEDAPTIIEAESEDKE